MEIGWNEREAELSVRANERELNGRSGFQATSSDIYGMKGNFGIPKTMLNGVLWV